MMPIHKILKLYNNFVRSQTIYQSRLIKIEDKVIQKLIDNPKQIDIRLSQLERLRRIRLDNETKDKEKSDIVTEESSGLFISVFSVLLLGYISYKSLSLLFKKLVRK